MTAMTDFLENALGQWMFENTAMPAPPSTFVALHTADPTETGGAAEVTGGAYARVQVNTDGLTSPFWQETGAGTAIWENNGKITFPTATADWGTVTHFSIKDALTGGNTLEKGPLDAPETVNSGNTFEFDTQQLQTQAD